MQKHFRKSSLLILIFGLGIMQLSCNDDEDNTPQPAVERGDFRASITGTVNKEMEGNARFSHAIVETQAAEGSQLQIILINEENTNEYISITIMVRDNMEGVDPGTYPVNQSSSQEPFVTIYYTSTDGMEFIATTTGTITLAERNEDAAWGSFSAKLLELQNNTVEITGDFNAEMN